MARLAEEIRTQSVDAPEPHLETCIICEEAKQKGIHICEKYICMECERKIVDTDVESKAYRWYVQKMRQIFFPVQAAKRKLD